MKKTLILAFAAFSANFFAQSSIQLRHIENNNTVLAPNTIIYETTAPSHNTHLNFDVTNTSNETTHIYNAKRYDVILNNEAAAYFCFAGNCYGASTMVSPYSLTLTPGTSASDVQGSYQILTADLDEGSVVGVSHIKYTFYDINNVSDSIQVAIKYNVAAPVGVKENNKTLSSFEIFPNPATEITTIRINSPKAFESSLVLFNSLGEVVYQKAVSVTEGKNKIDMNIENLKAGVYFASIKMGDATISKKLIIN